MIVLLLRRWREEVAHLGQEMGRVFARVGDSNRPGVGQCDGEDDFSRVGFRYSENVERGIPAITKDRDTAFADSLNVAGHGLLSFVYQFEAM